MTRRAVTRMFAIVIDFAPVICDEHCCDDLILALQNGTLVSSIREFRTVVTSGTNFYGRACAKIRLFSAAFAILCLAMTSPAMAAGKRVALIIGNSNYVNGSVLPNPGNDADKIAMAARRAGFDVTELKDLGQMQFRQALRDFRAKSDGAEIALLYYAGHGIEKDNANYLIPVDAKLADPIDLRDEGIDLALVSDNLSRAERRVILLDACRDNPFKTRWQDTTRSFFKSGLGDMTAPDNSLVIFATAAGMKTPDGETGGNSNFAIAVAEEMVKPGVELHDFGPAVMDNVKKLTGGQQKPFYSPTLDSTKVYFIAPALQANDEFTQDELDWAKAKAGGGNIESYRGYKRAHPGGRHYDAAQERMDDLFAKSAEGGASKAPTQQPSYVPPVNPPVIAGLTYQAPVNTVPAPPVAAPMQQIYTLPPAQPQVVGPVYQTPAPAPQSAPVVTARQVDASTTTVSPVAAAPQTMPQSATYVAPPISRQYGMGGFPIMPEPPRFVIGQYPTCKDAWQSVVDPLEKAKATNDCKNVFSAYKSNWLNKYREAMNSYSGTVNEIYTNEVANHFPTREAEKLQFYNETIRRSTGVLDGGFLMSDYEQALAKYNADFAAVVDSYYVATGCNGHPTPAGLAPNPNCPR